MKRFFLLFCFLSISQIQYSQNITVIKQKIDSIVQNHSQKTSINKIERPIVQNPYMAEKWDNINYDPYKYELKKYPFYIEFKDSTYASPISKKKVITSHYGWRRGRPHKGIDIDLVTGDDIMSMFDGIVRLARYSTGHGRTVVVRHFNGLETTYAHLSKYAVKINDTVKKGQIIGKGGTSGNARGSHLHLTVSYKGNYINPEYLFDFSENNKVRNQNIWVTKKWANAHYHSSKRQTELDLFTTQEAAVIAQNKENQKQIYVVKRGDTLSGISSKYRVSLSRLCKTNALKRTSVLKIGQKLIVNY